MKSKVYIETSVVSYATARPSRDLVVAARQEITRERWRGILTSFDCFVSVLVIEEAKDGDPEAAANRLSAIADMPILQIDDKAEALANGLTPYFPNSIMFTQDFLHQDRKARKDKEFLASRPLRPSVQNWFQLCRFGYQCPVFCSPDELIGDEE